MGVRFPQNRCAPCLAEAGWSLHRDGSACEGDVTSAINLPMLSQAPSERSIGRTQNRHESAKKRHGFAGTRNPTQSANPRASCSVAGQLGTSRSQQIAPMAVPSGQAPTRLRAEADGVRRAADCHSATRFVPSGGRSKFLVRMPEERGLFS